MRTNPKRVTAILMASAFAIVNLSTPLLGADCCQCGMCSENCASCCLECNTEDEEQSYYDIEYEYVCIPRVVFPWQKNKCCDGCTNNGACVRCIKKLKKKKHKCPICVYEWTPQMVGGCDCGGCCEPACGCESDCCEFGMIGSGPVSKPPALIERVSSTEPIERVANNRLTQE